ncbi:unnamed protein product [Rotaria socialis]|uniref:Uncharacterized protein n=1 Tax=Rotaria socialis TaxID=392032 RepID=A0A818X072_9BILA|nr:unnamed protein product [Rotaria socialis]
MLCLAFAWLFLFLTSLDIFFFKKQLFSLLLKYARNYYACNIDQYASIDNDEYSLDTDWMDYSSFHPVHALEDRAIHSRFWKRPRHRHFWKRSLVEPSMQNDNTVKSVSKQLQQQNKH